MFNFLKRNKSIDLPSNQTLHQMLEERAADNANSNTSYGTALLFGNYSTLNGMGLSAFFAAVNLISSSVAMLPLNEKQVIDNKDSIVKNSKIADLFNNTRLTKFNLIKKCIEDVLVKGNAFIHIKRDEAGNPIKLIYLRPAQVSIFYNEYTDELYYIVNRQNVKYKVYDEDMIHLVLHSNDGVNGLSIINYATRSINLANNAESSASDYFSSGMQIKGVLKTKTPITTDKQRQDIRAAWNQVHGGNNGSGLAVLSGVEDYIPMQNSANDAQLIQTRQYSVLEIARFFNINPILLGDLSHTSYSDIESANIEFLEHTLLPYIYMLQEEFTRKLIKTRNHYIDLDENELLKGNKQSMANFIKTLVSCGVITPNEGRKMLGLNAMEGGDELIVAYTDINANKVNQDANSDEKTDENKEEKE